jgi:hypothetical protein
MGMAVADFATSVITDDCPAKKATDSVITKRSGRRDEGLIETVPGWGSYIHGSSGTW